MTVTIVTIITKYCNEKLIFSRRNRLSQLLSFFLLGVVVAGSLAYGQTLMQAKTLKNFEPSISVHVQPQTYSTTKIEQMHQLSKLPSTVRVQASKILTGVQ
jgi:hypothetical protein